MKKKILPYLVTKNITIERACYLLNKNQKKSLIIVNSKKKVLGLVNDGDIRRALIKGFSVKEQIFKIMNRNPYLVNYKKIKEIEYSFFIKKKIDILPVIKNREIFDVLVKDQFSKQKIHNYSVIINTGGKGTRLRPFTKNKNKIMVNVVNKKNIGDLLLKRFLDQGFTDFIFMTNYKSSEIKKYFSKKYSRNNLMFYKEKTFLGTCGALSQLNIKEISNVFIFINCDVVSNINYNQLINFHTHSKLDLTIVSAQKMLKLDYGNINFKGIDFDNINEKPELLFTVNAGIYVFNKKILKFLKKKQKIDMPEFIKILKSKKKKIGVYPTFDYWLDIGTPQKLLEYKNRIQ